MLHFVGREFRYLWNQQYLPLKFCSKLWTVNFCRNMLTVAVVINLVRPATLASLWHWAFSIVYNMIGGIQRIVRFHLWQLRLVFYLQWCMPLAVWTVCSLSNVAFSTWNSRPMPVMCLNSTRMKNARKQKELFSWTLLLTFARFITAVFFG